MKVKLAHKAKWEMIFAGELHELHVIDFDRYDWASHLASVEVDGNDGLWVIVSWPGSGRIIAEGKCTSITDGKKQVKDKLKELGMLE